MPLDNTAKLSDIITALQTMEGINAKADLASVVGSPATASDSMASINSVIQTAKNILVDSIGDNVSNTDPLLELVGRLGSLKRWATGVTASQAGNLNLEVIGLEFKPSIVLAYGKNSSPPVAMLLYIEEILPNQVIFRNGSASTTGVKNLESTDYFIDGRFRIYSNYGTVTNYTWLAFE